MKLIVGLGNPGLEYARTKHNVGFMLVDRLAEELGILTWREGYKSLISEAFYEGEKVMLMKPLTYMNLSGEAVLPVMEYYKLEAGRLTVVHDDMDLGVGVVRLRCKGSSGGHRGVESIIERLKSEEFGRVRIGIGRPPKDEGQTAEILNAQGISRVNRHVLSAFTAGDEVKINEAIEYLVPAMLCIVKEGIGIAMNRYNPRRRKETGGEELVIKDYKADNQ